MSHFVTVRRLTKLRSQCITHSVVGHSFSVSSRTVGTMAQMCRVASRNRHCAQLRHSKEKNDPMGYFSFTSTYERLSIKSMDSSIDHENLSVTKKSVKPNVDELRIKNIETIVSVRTLFISEGHLIRECPNDYLTIHCVFNYFRDNLLDKTEIRSSRPYRTGHPLLTL